MKILFVRSNDVNPDSRVEKEVNSLVNAGHEVNIIGWDRSDSHLTTFIEYRSLNNNVVTKYLIGEK